METETHILVVDDQKPIRDLIEKALQNEGYRVDTLPDGEQAIERIIQNPTYALIITDLMMPGIDGLSVLTEARKHQPNTEAILITAHSSVESVVEALRLGAHDYIQKPFSVDELLHSVRRTLIYRRLKLEKAQLLSSLKQQSIDLTRILTASNRLAYLPPHHELPLDEIISIIGETLGLIIAITPFDQNGHVLPTVGAAGLSADWHRALQMLPSTRTDLQTRLAQRQRLGRAYYSLPADDAPALPALFATDAPHPTEPFLIIPLETHDGPTIGLLWIINIAPSPPVEYILRLEIVANQIAGTLENAGMAIVQHRQVHLRNLLVEASQQISTALNTQDVIDTLLEVTFRLLPHIEKVGLYYFERDRDHLTFSGRTDQGHILDTPWIEEQLIQTTLHNRQTIYHPYWTPEPTAQKSLIIEPLSRGSITMGLITIISHRPAAFPDDYRQILTMLANQAAIALHNAHLYHEAQRLDELGALVEAGQAINLTLDLKETLTTTLTVSRNLTGARINNIYLYTPEQNHIDSVITLGDETQLTAADRRHSTEIVQQTIENKEPNLVTVPNTNPATTPPLAFQSWLAVPLIAGESPLGVLVLGGLQPNAFTADDVRLIQVISSQAASAIENARLYEEIQRRLQQTEALGAITQSISTTLDVHRVLDLVVNSAARTIPAVTHSTLYLLNAQTNTLNAEAQATAYQESLPSHIEAIRQNVVQQAIDHLQPVRHSTADQATATQWSLLAIPLTVGESVIGAISIESPSPNTFHDSDEKLLSTFANHASVAIQKANLFRDLTSAYIDLRQHQNEILRSNRTLQALFDGITDGLYIVDRDLTIVTINQAEAQRLGQSTEALIGRQVEAGLWGDAFPVLAQIVEDTFSAAKGIGWESTHLAYNGLNAANRGPFTDRDVRTYPIFTSQKAVSQVIIFAQDVSEKRQLQATLFRSANLASIGQLASSIAHEINNPLTVIIANTQVMQLDVDPADPLAESLDYILTAGMRIRHIIQNLLDFSTQETYEWFHTELDTTIDDALVLIAAPLRKSHIEIKKDFGDISALTASASHLKLLWMNLILNARDAIDRTENPGLITISARYVDDDFVEVRISDNGVGIPPENASRLFLPFFTTKSPGQGPGLGLYICRNIVERHEGSIEVIDNADGPGATVIVRLPGTSTPPPNEA